MNRRAYFAEIWLRIFIWFYIRLYKKYDDRLIKSIRVISFWKLKHIVVKPGVVLIPLFKRRDSEDEQIKMILKFYREALSLNIKRCFKLL